MPGIRESRKYLTLLPTQICPCTFSEKSIRPSANNFGGKNCLKKSGRGKAYFHPKSHCYLFERYSPLKTGELGETNLKKIGAKSAVHVPG